MKVAQRTPFILLLILFIGACSEKSKQFYSATHENIRYGGRIDYKNPEAPVFIGSASFVEFAFTGNNCSVKLKKLNPEGEHNYVSVEIDGQYIDRMIVQNEEMKDFLFEIPGAGKHHIRIYKATEAQNNHVAFGGVTALSLESLPSEPSRKIEFIGNSITCAMGADVEEIPCGEGLWYDQHNAYWSYATQSAKALDAQFLLSSVSGIGMYRNWNSLSPVMPDVYENLYLNTDSTSRYDFSSYAPDLVSICLGTNDMSDGDGVKERLPFDSVQYVQAYLQFIGKVYEKYPSTQICLLSSPMMGAGDKREMLSSCLAAIKENADSIYSGKKSVALYDILLDGAPGGCTSHPDKDDQLAMTEMLVPFYQEVMGW